MGPHTPAIEEHAGTIISLFPVCLVILFENKSWRTQNLMNTYEQYTSYVCVYYKPKVWQRLFNSKFD